MKLLDENYAYVRERDYRILSTELPDDLLKKWLMPKPGEADAQEYMRNFADKRISLSEKHLPAFVFDYVLLNRFGRDIANFDETEMETAAGDLRIYILLLYYISEVRNDGQTPIEFDIFDMENYSTVIDRIREQAPGRWPYEGRKLSPAEAQAAANAIFGDLLDGFNDEIIRILDKYLVMDIGRSVDIVVQVVLRDKAHFDMNPKLSMRDNSVNMFVERIENRDAESFTLCLTEADIYTDSLMAKLLRRRKIERTDKTHEIVVKRGENLIAPCLNPASFVYLKNAVKRYDAYEQGLRKKVDFLNSREMKQEATDFMQEWAQAAERKGIDLLRFLNDL